MTVDDGNETLEVMSETPGSGGMSSKSMGLLPWMGLGALVLTGIVYAVVGVERSTDAVELPALMRVASVPAFSLTGRDGRTVTRDDLLGSVWIADFIFTTCSGPCPMLSLRMRSLQNAIREYDGKVKIVSFSVDPTYDTPAVLTKYADRYAADPDLWWFLTCDDEPAMHTLIQKGFLQAITPASATGPIIHSSRAVLVDREGTIRAWYDGTEASSKRLILRDVARLLEEPGVKESGDHD